MRELPGGEIVEQGLSDLRSGLLTESALVCLLARTRLRGFGIDVPAVDLSPETPEHRLYSLLEERLGRGAHSAYNALIRRIVSFARALRLHSTLS
jgi:hypothetical protein